MPDGTVTIWSAEDIKRQVLDARHAMQAAFQTWCDELVSTGAFVNGVLVDTSAYRRTPAFEAYWNATGRYQQVIESLFAEGYLMCHGDNVLDVRAVTPGDLHVHSGIRMG